MNNNPSILWAQDRANLYITIEIKNFKNQDITFKSNNVNLIGNSEKRDYNIMIELNSEINLEESSWVIKQNCIELKLVKNKLIFWQKLTKNKQNNIRIDWQKWKDEEDDEEEENEILQDFSSFQKQLPEEFMNKNFDDLLTQDLGNTEMEIEELNDINLEEEEEADIDSSSPDVMVENNDIYDQKNSIESLETEDLQDLDINLE